MQFLIPHPLTTVPTTLRRTTRRRIADALALDELRDPGARIAALEPSPLHVSKVRGAGVLTREPQPADVGAEVLVHLERGTRRPAREGPVRPGDGSPSGVRKGGRLRHGDVGEHGA